MTGAVAVAVQQKRQYKKSGTAGDNREQSKQPKVVAGKSRRNCHNLVGDRSQTLEQDDPGAPFGVGLAKRLDLVAVAIKTDKPGAHGVIEKRPNGIAEQAPCNRRHGAPRRNDVCAPWPSQRHRDQHYVGGHRKERAFRKRYGAHSPQCMWLMGSGQAPVIKTAQQRSWLGSLNGHPDTGEENCDGSAALANAPGFERDHFTSGCAAHKIFWHLFCDTEHQLAPTNLSTAILG